MVHVENHDNTSSSSNHILKTIQTSTKKQLNKRLISGTLLTPTSIATTIAPKPGAGVGLGRGEGGGGMGKKGGVLGVSVQIIQSLRMIFVFFDQFQLTCFSYYEVSLQNPAISHNSRY